MTLLKIENLKKYFKDVKAVDDISFEVKKGEIFGLLGPNGAGKSTTISMISTLLKPTSGDIYYNGESIIIKPKCIQKKLGIVPQEIALYPELTGYENLKFWGNVYGLRGKKLKDRIEKIAEVIGLSESLNRKVDKYSGGMKRRLNIGAALLHEPEILIMDEPTVGIDPQSRNHILDTVLDLNKKGMTIIYTSHYMEEVEKLCSHINIMDKGKVIASGTKEELTDILEGEKNIILSFDNINESLIDNIRKINYIENVEVNGLDLILKTHNGENIFKDIIDKIGNTDCKILSIDIQKANLESVFLYLTGRALRD